MKVFKITLSLKEKAKKEKEKRKRRRSRVLSFCNIALGALGTRTRKFDYHLFEWID